VPDFEPGDNMTATTWLLSSAGRRGGLVNLLKRVPESHSGNRVVTVDASPLSAAGRLADSFELVPRADSPSFVDEILRIAKFHQADIVIPTIDPELEVYSRSRQRFAAADVGIWVSAPEVTRLGADKWDLYHWLIQKGFPTVATVERGSIASAGVAGPVVAKPRSGSSSIGVVVADSIADIDLGRLGPEYLIQQRAPGIELTVDFAVDKHGEFLGAVPRRRLEVRAGEVSKGVTVKVAEVEELVRDLALTLPGAYGVLNVQIFFEPDSGALNIIEINPRFGGGYPLSHEAGADFITALLRSDHGERCSVSWEPGTVMLRYDEGAFYRSSAYAENPWR
jgi:carbamoyl-phosphate synthase large subunit